ncbi:P-loop containing nucleoside triphosphate hydrolase protein [Pleurotus eryngii]|uniref:P-loop containing nucleoside triphosphate hydrolase protein n=1 Tax=Pleurotus eryngii TaxID=5323 RepID=A0A9P6AAT6_PLEER|nr:P-loop containing nucleoside triphosphate hydrolase protein [Pleurotus eryngii]
MLVKRVTGTPNHYIPQSPQISSKRHGLRRLRRGIFEIAFEPPSRRYVFLGCVSSWPRIPPSVPYAARLLRDVFSIAPLTFATYILACLWTTGSSILSLYMAIMAVDLMSGPIQCGNDGGTGPLPALVYSFMTSTLVSTLVERMKKDTSMSLRGHLRRYFLPQLVRAKLEARVVNDASYPQPWQFEEVAPGWAIIEQLCFKASVSCVAFIQACILLSLYLKKTSLEFKLLVVFGGIYYPILLYTIPSDGVGGAEYTFWTSNSHYRRLAALYTLIFSPKYEEDIRKDEYNKEYEKTSRDLGVHRPDATALASNDIPRPLLWDLWSCAILDLPVLAFALTLPWSSPTNCIAKSILLRLMTESIRRNVDLCLQMRSTFDDTCRQAEKFYVPFTKIPVREELGVPSFPNPAASSKGMKVQFSDVRVTRKDAERDDLRNLSFIVHPGQIVAIVGPNASDKSTVLKLLPRLIEPLSGAILIDDRAIESINSEALRDSMTVLLQTPDDLYPISLKENITFGLANGKDFGLDLVDHAARLGGAYELTRRLGYDAIPTVVPILGQSMGASSKAAVDARNSAMSTRRPVQLTREEMQRILASRAFFRILCNSPRLVVIGDAFYDLDPVTETNILNNFISLRKGQSIIYAAHRVNNIVTQADLILYMENGLVEQGTHQQLLDAGGGYAAMYATNRLK